ncbi:serine hydrolase [Solitalea sp. MAHUQ-68]|uniref:beta-N-acetylhexosaminidase n=1 Tax=Solitalea agri TaxID=2953739 RepID=A0A9X2F9H3_9SPHI|nr:glycoside hydrolase family 3 N-terminal domain-containing protein [Solitalea agri]MCO4294273.1 serine hydrolase [Solitalea agri]
MYKKLILSWLGQSMLVGLFATAAQAQQFLQPSPAADHWADSVMKTLNKKQKIAQLLVLRASERKGSEVVFYEEEISKYIKKYKIGSVCLFQGTSLQQAGFLNRLQVLSKVPLLVCVDGETGLGMRFSDVMPFPDMLTVGATQDAAISYKIGKAIGEQCKRAGIQVNYAPVVDINNNPLNPVINFRSFGEDKYKVALNGVELMKGMQDQGVMACAKHFPGHGDVAVDSHLDLPVINKSFEQLDSLELYPFKQMISAGVGSMMVAHLSIPAIDNTPNQPTSLSPKNVTELLRNKLGFNGLTFTDALEMKGVAKFYPQGKAAVQSLLAGNDMLCLPGDIKNGIKLIRKEIRRKNLSKDAVNEKVRRVLLAKYNLGLNTFTQIDTTSLKADLNVNVNPLKKEVYENAITLLKQTETSAIPLAKGKKVAFVGIGITEANIFATQLKNEYQADCFYFDYKAGKADVETILQKVQSGYDAIVIGVHKYKKYPANNFGISDAAISLINKLDQDPKSVTIAFGNPYAIKLFENAANLVAAYDDDNLMQQAAIDFLTGKILSKGKLPVSISAQYQYGSGITGVKNSKVISADSAALDSKKLLKIDSIANNAIKNGATPGCVVLVARKGKVGFLKAYGYTNYDSTQKVIPETVYDLASVTKISATTVSIMKLYEEGKLNLDEKIGTYLPWVRGTDKEILTVRNILLHQAGLVAFIPFYKETLDASGKPKSGFYASASDEHHSVKVADHMYMDKNYIDTMYSKILKSKLGEQGKYIYSDNDFIFLGKIVEQITGKTLDVYAHETFYEPLHMASTTFKPLEHMSVEMIAPTEKEKTFRLQQIRGDVHDPGAAMFGGVAGHAGLFSNAYDLSQLYQLLLNGGELNGLRLLKQSTISYFTAYNSTISRRGLGFDKPEKDNATRQSPYPCKYASAETFGHTGFTGTCVWVDPKYDLVYIFLSNRVCPDGENNKLLKMNVRSDIQDAIYQSLIK